MKWRLELCHKDSSSLHCVLGLLRERPELCRSLEGFNVPNKSKGRKFLHDTSRWLASSDDFHRLRKETGANVVVHYSMKYQAPERNTRELCLSDFLKLDTRGCYNGGVLVVTGSKPKRNDSLSLLRSLQGRGPKGLPLLHCAFNPYLVDEKQREQEYNRLRSKLETGVCSGVWLQIGSDLKLLEKGLAFIRSLEGEAKTVEEVKVYGGLFLPSKQLLAQQRFRPWAGVKLGQEYLTSLEKARAITRNILKVFEAYDVVPLIESSVRKVEQLDELAAYLEGDGQE